MTENDIPENIRNRVHSKEVERLLQQVCTENNSFHMRYLIRSSADLVTHAKRAGRVLKASQAKTPSIHSIGFGQSQPLHPGPQNVGST